MTQASFGRAVDAALGMIDVRRWGGSLASIVSVVRLGTIGSPDVGEEAHVEVSLSTLVDQTGLSRGGARYAARRLVEQRVLVEDRGSGRRSAAWRINPEVGEWRVPWRVSRDRAMDRIAVAAAPAGPPSEVFARSKARALQPFARGPGPRATDRGAGALRHEVARVEHPSRAVQGPRENGDERAGQEPRERSRGQERFSSSSEYLRTHSLASEGGSEDPSNVKPVLGVLCRVAGAPIWGTPRERVVEAVGDLDDAQTDQVVRALQGGHGARTVLALVDIVEQAAWIAAKDEETPEAPARRVKMYEREEPAEPADPEVVSNALEQARAAVGRPR